MSYIDQSSASFDFTSAKTEIKTVAKGAGLLLLVGLIGGPGTLIIGSNVLQGGDTPGGIILLAIGEGLTALGLAMIIGVFGLRLHLNLLRAMEQLAGTLGGIAASADDQLGHRRDGT